MNNKRKMKKKKKFRSPGSLLVNLMYSAVCLLQPLLIETKHVKKTSRTLPQRVLVLLSFGPHSKT
jgi:hypothetical protein